MASPTRKSALCFCILSMFTAAPASFGQTTWDGDTSSDWFDAANWTSGVPTASVNATIPAGTPNAPSVAAAASCLDLSLAPGATVSVVSGFTLEVFRSLTGGSIAGPGSLRLVGSASGTMSSTTAPTLEIAKGGSAFLDIGTVTVAGSLTLTSGTCVVSASSTLTVTGNATFQGGSVGAHIFQQTTIDVAGNVTFSGTTSYDNSASLVIRCGGDWTAHASYVPADGVAVFDGAGSQTVSGTPFFGSVTVQSGSTVTSSENWVVTGNVTVNGTFTSTSGGAVYGVGGNLTVAGTMTVSGTLDVDKDLVVSTGGTLNAGSGMHAVGRDLTVNGPLNAAGTFVLDGSVNGFLRSPGFSVPSVTIAKAPSAFIIVENTPVTGSLTLTSGICVVAASSTLTVTGNATFQGGSVGAHMFQQTTIDVAGNVTFSGTTSYDNSASLVIRCGGDWTAHASYVPADGVAVFDGAGSQTVSGTPFFGSVTVQSGSTVTSSENWVVTGNVTVNGTFTSTSGGAVYGVGGNLTVAGTMTVSGTLDVDKDLVVSTGGTLNAGSGMHAVGRDLTVNGPLNAAGTFVLDGSVNGFLRSPGFSVPSVTIAKAPSAFIIVENTPVTGSLTLTSGICVVAASSTLTVTGNAMFQGGSVGAHMFQQTTIDVAGNVTFSGTTSYDNSASLVIRCGGDWTAHASYVPADGVAVFDGTGVQTVSGTPFFGSVTVQSGSTVTSSENWVVTGNVTVNGTLTSTSGGAVYGVGGNLTVAGTMTVSGTLDVDKDLVVSTGGTLNAGSGMHAVGRDLTVNGPLNAAGTFVLDGSVNGFLRSPGFSVPSVTIAKAPSAFIIVENTPVTGSLTLTSGICVVAASSTLTVTGNATFQGGSVGAHMFHQTTIEVAGNVTFLGTTSYENMASLLIRCGGNWTADGNYAPSGGTMDLNGSGTTTVSASVPGGTIYSPAVIVRNGTRIVGGDTVIHASTITIAAGAALRTSDHRLAIHRPAGTAVAVNGTLQVEADGELALGPATGVTINASGTLRAVGTFGHPATIGGEAGGGYALSVDGAIAALHFVFEEMNQNGIVVASSATIAAPPEDIRAGTFDFPSMASNAVLFNVQRPAPKDFRYLTFLNSGASASAKNVKTVSPGAAISFTNHGGAFAGAAFENDPNNLITWNPPIDTAVSGFDAVPGTQKVTVSWQTVSEIDVDKFLLEHGSSASGPFALLSEITPTGPGIYSRLHSGLVPEVAVFYRLLQRRTDGVITELASDSATPLGTAELTAQPQPQTVCEGAQAQFSVSAVGPPLTYQWRKTVGMTTTNVPGATGSTHTIPVTAVTDAGSYDVVVTTSYGSVTSAAASLTVLPFPVITTHPSSQQVAVGASVTLSVIAGNAQTYQWRKTVGMTTTNIFGATSSMHQISPAQTSDSGSYDCVVTNSCGSVTSNVAVLAVIGPPEINSQPASITACLGTPASLTVTASSPLSISYQWRHRGAILPGQTNPILAFSPVTLLDGGPYDVVVTSAMGSTTSAPAIVTLADFTTGTTYVVGFAATDVIAADLLFPLDGVAEIVVAQAGSDFLKMFRTGASGAPTPIVPTVPLMSGDLAAAVIVAPLVDLPDALSNNFLRPDIAVACPGNNVIRVFRNNGSTFTQQSPVVPPLGLQRPIAIAAGILLGDHHDLAIAFEGDSAAVGGGIYLALGSGAGFPAWQSLPAPPGGFKRVSAIAIADMDADSDLDVVATMRGADGAPLSVGNLLLYSNDGLGGFVFATALSANQNPRGVAISDLDGNGFQDIAVTRETPGAVTPGGILVFLHDGNPGMSSANFGAPLVFSAGVGPVKLYAADLGDDTIPGFVTKRDLVSVTAESGGVTLFRNFSGSSFEVQSLCAPPASTTALAIGDVTRDATPDLVLMSATTTHMTIVPAVPKAHAHVFGTGCVGTMGIPQVVPVGLPQFGVPTFGLQVTNARPNALALVALSAPGAPQDLGGGCTLYVAADPLLFEVFTNGSGIASIVSAVPPAFAPWPGLKIVAQWAVIDPLGGYGGLLSFSDALQLKFGY